MKDETAEQAIHRSGKCGKIIFRSCLCVFMLGIIGMTNTCTLVVSQWCRPLRVVAQWKQPDDVKYDGYSPYYLSVVELDWPWNLVGTRTSYGIYAGKNEDTPDHGHFIDFTFYYDKDDHLYEDITQVIKKANVEWTPEGITMTMSSGHQLFIPQRYFTGGR
jgi:hypothetical protein